MNTTRRIAAATLLTLALILGALAGCGHGTKPGSGGSASPVPSVTSSPPPSGHPTPPSSPPPSGYSTTAPPSSSAGTTVVLSRVAYQWRWPNADGQATVTHTYPVPPVPELVRIGAGDHPSDPGERPFNRMSFTFTTAFPSYQFQFVDKLVADGSGKTIPLEGRGVLRVTFRQAQAHTEDGRSSITAQPSAHIGYKRIVAYAPAGDFEGVVTYGLGITWPVPHSNPQIAVRAYEVETVNAQGQHRYVVAIDVDAR